MYPTEEQRQQARAHTHARFRRVECKTTYTSRCYEEWYEIWETKDGSPVINEDIEAFKLQPRGQGHSAERLNATQVKLECICDSGD